jgi:hypothetical protein
MSESQTESGSRPGTENSPARPVPPASPAKPGRDKVKAGFIVVVLGLIVLVWYLQRQSPQNLDWDQDLPKAMQQAKVEDRRLLVLVTTATPGEEDQFNNNTIGKNKKVLAEGRFILVKVVVPLSLDAPFAKEHQIAKVPTMLLLDSKGNELNRRAGRIGEVEFRKGFLDCQTVVKPGN